MPGYTHESCTAGPHLLRVLRGTRLLLGRARLLPLQRRLQLLLRLLQGRQLLAVLPRRLELGVQLGGGLQATQDSQGCPGIKDRQ